MLRLGLRFIISFYLPTSLLILGIGQISKYKPYTVLSLVIRQAGQRDVVLMDIDAEVIFNVSRSFANDRVL